MEGLVTGPLAWGVVAAVGGGAGLTALWIRSRRSARAGAASRAPAVTRPARSLRDGLAATRQRLGERLEAIVAGGRRDASVLQEIEEALIAADIGVRTSHALIERIAGVTVASGTGAAIRTALREQIIAMFPPPRHGDISARPRVVLVTGVNGVGKTTTVGKLAAAAVTRGQRVLLVAADTYRAAAIEQLEAWGKRLGVEVVRHAPGASPSAVAFDGVTAGRARGVDLVLIDTAGRLHTRSPLMEELRKVRRTVAQVCAGAPHETLLVLDATTGQNAIAQAKAFVDAVDVSGVIVSKLDGTAKGGVALAVAAELGLPVEYIGVGEGPDDLRPFDAAEYASGLLEGPEDH